VDRGRPPLPRTRSLPAPPVLGGHARRRLLRLFGWRRLMPSNAAVVRPLASTLKQRGRPQSLCVRRPMGRDALIVRPTRNSRAQSKELKRTRHTVGEAHDACFEAGTSRLSLRWRPRSAPECELVESAGLRRSAALGVRDAGRVASARHLTAAQDSSAKDLARIERVRVMIRGW